MPENVRLVHDDDDDVDDHNDDDKELASSVT